MTTKKRTCFLTYLTGTKWVLYALNLSTNKDARIFLQRGVSVISGVYLLKTWPRALNNKPYDFETWRFEFGSWWLFIFLQQSWDVSFKQRVKYMAFCIDGALK